MERIQLFFKPKQDIHLPINRLALALNGVFMELIPDELAHFLHNTTINPYSLSVEKKDESYIWNINLLTDEMIKSVKSILLSTDFKRFNLKAFENKEIIITHKKLVEKNESDFAENFYSKSTHYKYKLEFISSTAFKKKGSYVFFPDIRLIIQSLMMKYGALVDKEDEINTDFLDDLVSTMSISSYNLQSHYFKVHNNSIPAFKGEITLIVRGNQSMKKYLELLLNFGEFSGVGMKTSLGMGNFKIKKAI